MTNLLSIERTNMVTAVNKKIVLNQIKRRRLIFGTITKQLRGQITEVKLNRVLLVTIKANLVNRIKQ